jgi:hypothetical protein
MLDSRRRKSMVSWWALEGREKTGADIGVMIREARCEGSISARNTRELHENREGICH